MGNQMGVDHSKPESWPNCTFGRWIIVQSDRGNVKAVKIAIHEDRAMPKTPCDTCVYTSTMIEELKTAFPR